MKLEWLLVILSEILHGRGAFGKQVTFNSRGKISHVVTEMFFILKVKILMENNLNSQVANLPT